MQDWAKANENAANIINVLLIGLQLPAKSYALEREEAKKYKNSRRVSIQHKCKTVKRRSLRTGMPHTVIA